MSDHWSDSGHGWNGQGSSDGLAARGGDESELPTDVQPIHRTLLRDGAAWRTKVPDNARLNARVRTLPMEMARPDRAATRPAEYDALPFGRVGRHGPQSPEIDATAIPYEGARGDTMRNTMIRKVGAWAGGAAAMLVVLLLAGLLVQMANGQAGGQRGFGSGTVSAPSTPTATAYPGTIGTPTIGSKYVTSAVTARGVDSNGNAVNPTSTFAAGQKVYVVAHVSNPPVGQHRLSIEWFLNGQQVNTPPEVSIGKPVTGSANVSFTNVYTYGGRGTARIYWDLPSDTSYDLDPDAFLARDVAFEVQGPASVPTATPPPGPTPTPGAYTVATPTAPPTPTPTPGS